MNKKLESKINLNTQDLCNWLHRKIYFFGDYEENFFLNHIDGRNFFELNNARLTEMGIQLLGHRLRFMGLIRRYKR
jgi:hypothetical protein